MEFRQYLKEALRDLEVKREYRRVLEEELRELLAHLRLPGEGGFSLTLGELALQAGLLGLSLSIELGDGEGKVAARFTLSPEEARVL